MPAVQEGPTLGDLLKYEVAHCYSRDQVTVAAGQTLPLGVVVGMETTTFKVKQFAPSATDGSQHVAGVLIQAVDALLVDREDGLMIARHAIVADHALIWPTGITHAEKSAALQQLRNLGILVRKGV